MLARMLGVFVLPVAVFAAEASSEVATPAKRSSSIGVTAGFAQEEYREFRLSGRLGLDETWRLSADLQTFRTGGITSSSELRLGADAVFGEAWAFRLSLVGRGEPNEIRSAGLLPGVDWNLSTLWDGELLTTLSLDLDLRSYSRKRNAFAGRLKLVTQAMATLGLRQEVSRRVSLGVSVSSYRYSLDPSELSDEVLARLSKFPGIEGVISGFPESGSSADIRWQALDSLALGLAGSASRVASDGTIARSLTVSAEWAVDSRWMIAVDATGSRAGDGSASGGGLLGVSVEYGFE